MTHISNAATSARTVLRSTSAAIVWIVAALALGCVAYHAMYSSFEPYDDSGYWTIALRSYIEHGSLYNHTYTQCGPFYYEFWSCVYWLTGATVNPDSGYFLSLCAWIGASSLIGGACWLLTGWLTLGLCGVAASFILFETFTNEPMEPAHLSYVLMGLLFVALCSQPRLTRRRQPFVGMTIGVLCAALVLTKVNIGLFATCGVAFTVGFCWPEPAVRRFTRPLASLGLLLLPPVVMWESLDSAALSHFSDLLILIELSTGALLAVLWTTSADSSPLETRTVWVGTAGFIAASVLISLGVLIDGTSLSQLISGAFLSQRNLAKIFSLPLFVPTVDLIAPLGGCVIAGIVVIGLLRSRPEKRIIYLRSWPAAVLRLLAGAWMLLSACGPNRFFGVIVAIPTETFVLAIPLLWVAALGQGDREDASMGLVRVALCAIGMLGCLELYPVAGSQMPWAAGTLVPAAVLCMWDGLALLRSYRFSGSHAARLSLTLLAPVAAAAIVCAALVVGQIIPTWNYVRNVYAVSAPLQVGGGTKIRQYEPTAEQITLTARFLKSHCTTFEGSPGLNSFYFFAGEPPPTGLNTTQWRRLLSAKQQATILRKLRTIPRLCVLENSYANAVWYRRSGGYSPIPPPSPLYRYLVRNFVTAATYGDYTVQVRGRRSPR